MKEKMSIYTIRDIFQRPISIRSIEGMIVVTRKDDTEDYILAAGEVLTIRPRGLLAISGLTTNALAMIFGGKSGREGRSISFPIAG